MERKLVTLRKIEEKLPIEGADRIELIRFDGWQVVSQKGIHEVGDTVFYFEIDSFLPTDREEFSFLKPANGKVSVYNGVEGHKLRTIRLKKQLSQGLILSRKHTNVSIYSNPDELQELFGVQKWDKPLPAELAGTVKSTFPTHIIPKTDQERIQNISHDIEQHIVNYPDDIFEITIKLDGSSMTVYKFGDEIGVCSRNMDLVEDYNNTLWRVARDQKLIEWVKSQQGNYALQGELMGEGIQGNPEKLKGQHFFLYDIYNIDEKRYLSYTDRLALWNRFDDELEPIEHCPSEGLVDFRGKIPEGGICKWALLHAEGESLTPGVNREGLVFKSWKYPSVSFKAISNSFLEKEKD